MSEEEAIKILKDIKVTSCKTSIVDFKLLSKVNQAIQGLLDLYEAEKEKNKELELSIDKLNEEKEEYRIAGQTNFVNAFINSDYISKDKIKEKIKELDNIKLCGSPLHGAVCKKMIYLLQDLLKESEIK